jgi:hypothetical protein
MAMTDALEERIDETRNEPENHIFSIHNGIERHFPESFDPAKQGESWEK